MPSRKLGEYDQSVEEVLRIDGLTPAAAERQKLLVAIKRREGPLAAERLIERAGLGARARVKEDEFQVIVPITDRPAEAHKLVRDTLGLANLHEEAVEEAKQSSGKRPGWLKGW